MTSALQETRVYLFIYDRYSTGDVSVPVCLQSTSMPLTYAFALSDLGEEVVHRYVGQEPSGGAFNELKLGTNSKWTFIGDHISLNYLNKIGKTY